jgi:hypothetical protein
MRVVKRMSPNEVGCLPLTMIGRHYAKGLMQNVNACELCSYDYMGLPMAIQRLYRRL